MSASTVYIIGMSLDWRQPVVGGPGAETRAIPRGRTPLENLVPSN